MRLQEQISRIKGLIKILNENTLPSSPELLVKNLPEELKKILFKQWVEFVIYVTHRLTSLRPFKWGHVNMEKSVPRFYLIFYVIEINRFHYLDYLRINHNQCLVQIYFHQDYIIIYLVNKKLPIF